MTLFGLMVVVVGQRVYSVLGISVSDASIALGSSLRREGLGRGVSAAHHELRRGSTPSSRLLPLADTLLAQRDVDDRHFVLDDRGRALAALPFAFLSPALGLGHNRRRPTSMHP